MNARAGGRYAALAIDVPQPFHGGQIVLPPGPFDWLRLTFRATEPAGLTVWLHYAGGTEPEPLQVPAGEQVTVRLPVTRRDDLQFVRFPEHNGLTLLALTALTPAAVRDIGSDERERVRT